MLKKKIYSPLAIFMVLIIGGSAIGALLFVGSYSFDSDPIEKEVAQEETIELVKESRHVTEDLIIEEHSFFNLSWPKIKDIEDEDILENIEEVLSFEKEVGVSIEDYVDAIKKRGEVSFEDFNEIKDELEVQITTTSYWVNYDEGKILSVSLWLEGYSAYTWGYEKRYSFNLSDGSLLQIEDLVKEEKITQIILLADKKLQENIEEGKEHVKNLAEELDEVNKEYVEWWSERAKEESFRRSDLDNFKIIEEGVVFTYTGFDLGRGVRELEPEKDIFFSFKEMESFLKEDNALDYKI